MGNRVPIDNKSQRTEISQLGEVGLIDHLTKNFKSKNASTIKGVGDDAAVIKNGDVCSLITTDLLIENIHFDLAYTPLKHLGYKSVVVNLSDIYAMNGTPQQITFSISISNRFSVEALEDLYAGVQQACDFYHVDLIGGDTTSSVSGLMISVTAIGMAKEEDIVYRNTAKAGDLICVSGDLGAPYIGLQLLEREKQVFLADPNMQPELKGNDYMIGRFLKPEAKKDIIELFKSKKVNPTAMIDISDGLSSEIFHICKQSEVGCLIREADIPIHGDTYNTAFNTFNIDPTTCALNGGEDYELLFTLDKKDYEKLKDEMNIICIGEIVKKEEGRKLLSKSNTKHDLLAQGWNAIKD